MLAENVPLMINDKTPEEKDSGITIVWRYRDEELKELACS